MNYFFDESGNWDSIKGRDYLVLGGIGIADKNMPDVIFAVESFRKANNLKSIHACDSNPILREKLLLVISELISAGKLVSAVKFYSQKYLKKELGRSRTDELYLKEAADFVQKFIFGDNHPAINWDPKFKYSFIEGTIKHISRKERWNSRIRSVDEGYVLNGQFVENKWNEMLSRVDKKSSPSLIIQQFKDKVVACATDTEKAEIIKSFELSELELYLTQTLTMRERFNQRIEDRYENTIKRFSTQNPGRRIRVNYIDKHAESRERNGIEIVDFLCFLFYTGGKELPSNSSSALKSIYANTEIEVI